MLTKKSLTGLALAALVAGAGPALAQDYNQPPAYGAVDLTAGFEPDPHTLQMQAGGDIDASTLGNNCLGYIANAPDYRLNYTAGSFPLIFSVASSADTTLVISDNNGNWVCDDDSGGDFNPSVRIASPQSGQYDIWVGTYSSGALQDATLSISEIDSGAAPSGGGQTLDWNLAPNYGEVALAAGFTPDPHELSLTAGGDIDASVAASPECRGYVTSAPDYRIQYTAPASAGGKGGASATPLIFSVMAPSDTTLVISGPDAQWLCDDDSGGNLNPQVTVAQPQTGQYDVWVGVYGDTQGRAAILTVSEFQ